MCAVEVGSSLPGGGQRLALLGPIFALEESQFKPTWDLFASALIERSDKAICLINSRQAGSHRHGL